MSELTPKGYEARTQALEHEALIPAHTPEKADVAQLSQQQEQLGESAHAEIAGLATAENPVAAYESAQAEAGANRHSATQLVTRELKKLTLNQELRRLQRKEKLPVRSLSKVIHQPVIRAVSEGAGKTVSRPSGLLGGGILAFAGSLLYLYFTKHYGVTYNYLLFTMFFVGGFALGLVIELAVWMVMRGRRADV